MEDRVVITVEGHIGKVILNRPEARNALSREMWDALTGRMRELEDDPNVRVVVITGAGQKAFSAGADFADLMASVNDPDHIAPMLTAIEQTMSTIEQMSKPVIAKINGAAIGGGCELASACDLRIAADTATFGIPAGRLGIAITWQDTRRLASLVGVGWTRDLLMTGEIIDASTAKQIGLVNRVVPAADLDRETDKLAERVATMAPLTLQAAKRYTLAVARGHELVSVEDGLALAKDAWASEEFKWRVKSVEKQRRKMVEEGGGNP
jgi:enoyl-CoA hydratase/carnithine racemase